MAQSNRRPISSHNTIGSRSKMCNARPLHDTTWPSPLPILFHLLRSWWKISTLATTAMTKGIFTRRSTAALLRDWSRTFSWSQDTTTCLSRRNYAIGEMEFDGATMVYLIFMKTYPSTVVGLDSVLKKLETTKLGYHSNCVDTMLTIMEGNYKNLREMVGP